MKTNKKGETMTKTRTEVKFFTDKGTFEVVSLGSKPLVKAFNYFKERRDINTGKLSFKDATVEKVVVKKYPYTVTLNYTKFLNLINN